MHGEVLVELAEADVIDPEPVLLQQLWDGEYRTNAHLVGGAPNDGDAAIGAERLQSPTLGLLRLHQQRGGCTVGELRGVAGGEEPAPFSGRPPAENPLP